jgi:beta-galactosidase
VIRRFAGGRDEKNGDWIMAIKNENHTPAEKNIRIVRAKRLADGFPTEVSNPVSRSWVEGPSPLFVGDTLYVYMDFYRNHRYGAVRS